MPRRGKERSNEGDNTSSYLTVAAMAFSLVCRGGGGSSVTAPAVQAEVELRGREVDVEAGIQKATVA